MNFTTMGNLVGLQGNHSLINRTTLGVVLAGGKSSRMGENKALLHFGGVRLVDHISNVLFSIRPPLGGVIVSGVVNNTSFLPDKYRDIGPLGGVATVLEHIKDKGFNCLLITPTDMPLLRREEFQTLLENIGSAQSINYKGFELPLLLSISSATEFYIRQSIEDESKRSFRWLLKQLTHREIKTQGERFNPFLNINTPSEWRDFNESKVF